MPITVTRIPERSMLSESVAAEELGGIGKFMVMFF